MSEKLITGVSGELQHATESVDLKLNSTVEGVYSLLVVLQAAGVQRLLNSEIPVQLKQGENSFTIPFAMLNTEIPEGLEVVILWHVYEGDDVAISDFFENGKIATRS
ncbi:hypothetical protein KBD71_05675 [Candidatus Woesebacteria bacterium]|nr:hypothetical protein [Candidatus Woesebacteria bacterium]